MPLASIDSSVLFADVVDDEEENGALSFYSPSFAAIPAVDGVHQFNRL